MIQLRRLVVTIALLSALPLAVGGMSDRAQAGATGAGASFPQLVYGQWGRLFGAETGEAVSYDGVGSGEGIKAIETGTVTFGATDVPLSDKTLDERKLVQFPTLVGGVLPVVNIPGIGPGDLVLDGQTFADLIMGRTGFWDDPAIARLNPRLPLPHLAAEPVIRADASGTSTVVAAYLARTSKGWEQWVDASPRGLRGGGILASGSAGMAEAVSFHLGAIGYVGFDVAQAKHLIYVNMKNPAGHVVQPTLASVAAAAASADWSHGLTPELVAQPGDASWPIVSATYVLMRHVNPDGASVRTALRFFDWAARTGGPVAEDLGFVPLPDTVVDEVRRVTGGVEDLAGHSLAPLR